MKPTCLFSPKPKTPQHPLKNPNDSYDFDSYDSDLCCCKPVVTSDKNAVFRTDLHYSDPDAKKELTVFGAPSKGLFYNYSDRVLGDRWTEGVKLAAAQARPSTARFYEIALNHFHGTNTVNLQHVILGCNRMNGYSYMVFGYTYDASNEK